MPLIKVKKDGKLVKDKNGRQAYRVRVNFVDANGKKKQVERMAYGFAEATVLEQQLVSEYKGEKRTPTSRMTVRELVERYEVYHSNETRKTSHETIMGILRSKVLPTMGDIRLDKLTKVKLENWKNEINSMDIALKTKQSAYATFRALLNYAVRMEFIPKNLLSELGNFKDANVIVKPADTLHYYTPEQFLEYIAVAENNAKKTNTVVECGYYVFFNIAFYTGARKGEIHALKWSDIDGSVMHIRRSISQKIKGGDVESPPKNKSSYRDLIIPDPLIEVLKEHKKRQKAAAGDLFSEDMRICGGKTPLRDTSIENKNIAFAKAANLPHIRIHDFRHPYVKYTTKNYCDNLMKIFACTVPIRRTSAKGTQSQSCCRGKRTPALSASPQVF